MAYSPRYTRLRIHVPEISLIQVKLGRYISCIFHPVKNGIVGSGLGVALGICTLLGGFARWRSSDPQC